MVNLLETREVVLQRLVKQMGLKVGVEIGVREGMFSRHLLCQTELVMHGVDVDRYEPAANIVHDFPGRWHYHLMRSSEAAGRFRDEFFDFVHIDANHSYASVKEDLALWWPKLRPGGLFTGDDYLELEHPQEGRYGVIEAVEEFRRDHLLVLNVTGLLESADEQARRAFARDMGEKASRYFRGGLGYHEGWLCPAWWCVKPGGVDD